jgi:capsular polysaccharide biosynthesis protein
MRTIEDAFISGSDYIESTSSIIGAVYDKDGTLIRESQRPDMGAWKHTDPQERLIPQDIWIIEEGAYHGHFHSHFGHFLLETLPALNLASKHELQILCHPWPNAIRSEQIPSRYRGFLLEAIGVVPGRISLIREDIRVRHLKVQEILGLPLNQASHALIEANAKVRNYSLKNSLPLKKNVYLSRRKFSGGSNRQIVNEDAVEAVFQARGFVVVYPEELAMKEQILSVADADVVAGGDGSAMHLCGFMRPKAKCLIIESRRQIAVEVVNNAIGLETHRLLICSTTVEPGKSNVLVNIDALNSNLDRLLV